VGQWAFESKPEYFYRTLIFLFVGTAGLFRFLLRTKQNRPDFFVQFYLATMVVKLIAYGAYLFVVVTAQTEKTVADVAFFMAVYFIFTAIEIGFLYRQVNQ
jgi:hypothetical protein